MLDLLLEFRGKEAAEIASLTKNLTQKMRVREVVSSVVKGDRNTARRLFFAHTSRKSESVCVMKRRRLVFFALAVRRDPHHDDTHVVYPLGLLPERQSPVTPLPSVIP